MRQLESFLFDPQRYGESAARLLALDGAARPMPLLASGAPEPAARLIASASAAQIFPNAFAPEAALAGLWLYFSDFERAHRAAQDLHSPDGSFWHAIAHRREPDSSNAAYWFRKTGAHPVFPALAEAARPLAAASSASFRLASSWDPFAFLDLFDLALRSPGSPSAQLAQELQLLEWQILFDHCARPRS